MKGLPLYAIVVIVLSAACNNDGAAPATLVPVPTTGPSRSAALHSPLVLSPREEALVQQLEAKFPESRGADLRKQLTDPSVAAVSMPSRPDVQAIFAEIAAIREAEARKHLAAPHSRTVHATLAMLEQWPDPSATAIALHRPGKTPEHIILLPSNATPGNLAAGLRALGDVLKQDTSTTHESRLVAHRSVTPPSWKASSRDRLAQGVLTQLAGDPTSELSGIGRARTLLLPVQVP